MLKGREPASTFWEVERQSCGETFRPYCVVILRNKKQTNKSVVKASSSDFASMKDYADQLSEDLYVLSNDEFVNKYKLGSAA